jgi:Family of unknown function (DUF6186)
MNAHDLTVLGYVLILIAGVALELIAVRPRYGIPPLGEIFTRIMRTRTGRVGVLVAWAWVGVHFFAR